MPHYFDEIPPAARRPGSVPLVVAGRSITLATDSGVFAADRLDPGTGVLLDRVPAPPETGDLLDLGCGYGPIALSMAIRSPAATVWAVDVNARARDLTAHNARVAGCPNIRVCAPEAVLAGQRFDAIWSNPPIRIGQAPLHDLLIRWLDRLAPEAAAYLVVQRHLGADSLQRWLAGAGHPATRLGSRKGFRILRVVTARAGGGDRADFDPGGGVE